MKEGYTVDIIFDLPTKDTTHILVYNWHSLNEVGFPCYSLKSDQEIEERPAKQNIVAIFKIKYK